MSESTAPNAVPLTAETTPFTGSLSAKLIRKAEPVVASQTAANSAGLNLSQTLVVIQEVKAIEKSAHRAAVILSESVSKLYPHVENAVNTRNVPAALLADLRDKLALLAEVSTLAIMCGCLSTRLNPSAADLKIDPSRGDLAPKNILASDIAPLVAPSVVS
jgi:hypothetical protein